MFLSKVARKVRGVFVGLSIGRTTGNGFTRFLFGFILLFTLFFPIAESQAYTTVLISTAAPAGLEAQFLANATNYLNGNIVPNPFAANVYQLTLYGLNPNYVPPTKVSIDTTTWFQTISQVSSDTFVNGYADGLDDGRANDVDLIQGLTSVCNSSDVWYQGISTETVLPDISTFTCNIVLDYTSNLIYNQYFDTTTWVVPGF